VFQFDSALDEQVAPPTRWIIGWLWWNARVPAKIGRWRKSLLLLAEFGWANLVGEFSEVSTYW